MYNNIRWSRASFIFLIGVLGLTACIQPVSKDDATLTANAPYFVPTQPVQPIGLTPTSMIVIQTPVAVSWALVEQFIWGGGHVPNNLQVWSEQSAGPDRVHGFSYTGSDGLPCTGFLLMVFNNGVWQSDNGALVCAQPGNTAALASVTFFFTSGEQPYTIVFGRVADPSVTAIAVEYNDGSYQNSKPVMGGFMFVRPGVVSATLITAINAQGNTVIPNIPQTPV